MHINFVIIVNKYVVNIANGHQMSHIHYVLILIQKVIENAQYVQDIAINMLILKQINYWFMRKKKKMKK